MGLRGTNQESGRPYNRRIVLETIRLHAPISRGDIARRVGLTVQTVSTIIRELELQGFLIAEREPPKGRGFPATSLAINPDGGLAIGINVTPMGIDAALVNLAGEIIGRKHRNIAQVTPERAFAEISSLTAELKALRSHQRILGAGLAMPGPFDVESMSFVGPTTLEGWKGIKVQDRLAETSQLPAFTDVDVAAAALGERLYGAGRGLRDFYYIYLAAGLGGTMVHEGQALRGANGNAGEIGHLPSVPGGLHCPCGNRGCLERYLSLEARDRRVPAIGEEGWIAETAPLFRAAIVTIENLFDPETIIFGGLAESALLEKLIEAAQPLPHSIAERRGRMRPRLIPSAAGADAVLRGAAALAISGLLAPRIDPAETGDPLMAGHAA